MSHAVLFPGQGSQFIGMARKLYDEDATAREWMEAANRLMGGELLPIMFEGPEETLRQTRFTQPAIFLHSYVAWKRSGRSADMAAGHSLGEFTALAAAGALEYEEAFGLVALRGSLMQKAGEESEGTMAAVIGLEDASVESLCAQAAEETKSVVVPANYNSPGQLVISGSPVGVRHAVRLAEEAGCRMAKELTVSGAFHSPLMTPASDGLRERLDACRFTEPSIPVYSNVTAEASRDPHRLKENVYTQLLNPVRWTQTLLNMHADGAVSFTEAGPGNVLRGLMRRTLKGVETDSVD